jgi:N,N-dimethylformamidase
MDASTPMTDRDVTVVGYCEPVSCRPGGRVELKLSSDLPGPLTIDVVRLICGDRANPTTGLVEHEVNLPGFPVTVEGRLQPLTPGSYATMGPSPVLGSGRGLTIGCSVRPSVRPEHPQPFLRVAGQEVSWGRDGFGVGTAADAPAATTGPLDQGRWYDLVWSIDSEAGTTTIAVAARSTHSPGIDSTSTGGVATTSLTSPADGSPDTLVVGRGLDGRVAGLWLADEPGATRERAVCRWDASIDMDSTTWLDTGTHQLHGTLHQLPTRAVRGPDWDGSSQTPATAPSHYDAVHFHTDDLYDAGWDTTAVLDLPTDLPSGVYCFRTRSDHGEDRTPFFVAAPTGRRSDVAFLVPMATYLAYANQRIHLTNRDFVPGGGPPPANHRWLRDHPEVGYSHYEYHSDRSGVMFSSRRRPVMNLKPGADTWGFTPDTNIIAFLDHLGIPVDMVTDEQVHDEGDDALAGYRVVVTGSHPEYWSTAMLDTLERWQRDGGRLMYLGGNGFYWRVAFSDHWPGAMEVRRAEDGTRAWIAESGEYHHAFGGEYGGLWRRLGRAPNQICGVGFAAQGFGKGSPYVRSHEAPERTDWIFEGVDGDRFGAHGVGGGAAGQEIDRYDVTLGSPAHAVVVASATEHDAEMLRTKEEFHVTVKDASNMSRVRADMVFYEIDGGGAVFSTGSIAWFGGLATNGYDNDVARITENVLRRFLDPAPFAPPT